MYKKSVFIFLCTCLFACTNPDVINIPPNVLPEEKMAEVLVDIHLLEATMNLHAGTVDKQGAKSNPISIDLFGKHHITKQQFDESYTFYTENPEKLMEVYQLVLNDLSKMQATVLNGK